MPRRSHGLLLASLMLVLAGVPFFALRDNRAAAIQASPNVFSVSPENGPTTGGFTITLTGSGFTNATSVSVGEDAAVPAVVNDGLLTIVAPAHAAGLVHLHVTGPGGTSHADSDDDFTYVATTQDTPTVLSIAPASGPVAGGTEITITGQNLQPVDYVDFDGQHVVPTSTAPTQLVVTSPAHAADVVHLRVVRDGSTSPATGADNFRYLNPPVVTSVSPNLGSINGGAAVTISGTGLSGVTQVLFGETPVAPAQVSSGSVLAYSPAHSAGTVHVRVHNNGGTSSTSAADQFTFAVGGPFVTGISPASGPTSGGTLISISGSGLWGAYAVSFGSLTVVPYSVTDTLLRVIAPARAPGVVHLRVTTNLGTSPETALDDYTYTPGLPVVQQVTPRNGPVAGGTAITISGSGFTDASSVRFGSQLVAPSSVTENQLVVIAPQHAAGVVHLLVTTPVGTSIETVLDDYTYGPIAPQVAAISPTLGPSSGGTVITISGSGFSTAIGVAFGDQVVAPTTVSATQVVVTAPAHTPGLVHLRVITPTMTSPETSLDDYTYGGLPIVLGITPSSGSTQGGTEVTINGSGFSGTQSVSFGDFSVTPHFVSENQLRVIAPRGSAPGVVHLRVTTTAGISPETAADNFTYVLRPLVTSVSPNAGSTVGGTAIVIRGVGFTGAGVINFGGVGVVPLVVTDTEIQVISPAHAAGVVHLKVTSVGGISPDSATDDFTYVPAGPDFCPEIPLWTNDLAYGSPGGGFYWDPVSGMVWTAQRSWHLFAPQPPRPAPQPLWVNALTYGSPGGGFYWDPVSWQVWTAERGWHSYSPQGCVAR